MKKHEYFESLYPENTHLDEVAKIVGFIKTGKSCQVLGIPGSGRSTLLSLLSYNRKVRIKHFGDEHKQVHFVMANFSEVKKRSLFDVMKFLFLNLTESLREREMFAENKAVGDIFREHLKFKDELILFQGFKEAIDYFCLNRKMTVVFLFDRFEEYIPTVGSEFFTNLRVLRNRAKYKFSVVFSLYHPLEKFLETSQLFDYYEFVAGNLVFLPISDKTTTDLRIGYIEKIVGKKINPEILKEIVKLTGGAGRLVKLSVEAVLAHDERNKNLSDFLLSQQTVKSALLEIWSILTPAEQAGLLQEKYDDETSDYLEKIGLLREGNITIPFLALLIKAEFGKLREKTAIVFDQNTNTIRRGEDVLSDQLTAAEFRLLRFFLQNTDRVIERDELINVVWADNKSTAGITDQAVDQLIFRLRRKIETDTNNPLHLLTAKGRGFRFVS